MIVTIHRTLYQVCASSMAHDYEYFCACIGYANLQPSKSWQPQLQPGPAITRGRAHLHVQSVPRRPCRTSRQHKLTYDTRLAH